MPGLRVVCMGEDIVLFFYRTKKEQALLKWGRFRVDFRRDFLMDTQNTNSLMSLDRLLLFGSVFVCACI